MIDDIKFNLLNDSGIEETYLIIDKFEKDDKKFILYQEENKEELYASFYEIIDDKIKLTKIENDEDYDIVDEYLERL